MSGGPSLVAGARGGPWMAAGVWADTVSTNFPVKKLKYQEGGHLQAVSSSLGVQLALEVSPLASCPWSLAKVTHLGSILRVWELAVLQGHLEGGSKSREKRERPEHLKAGLWVVEPQQSTHLSWPPPASVKNRASASTCIQGLQ